MISPGRVQLVPSCLLCFFVAEGVYFRACPFLLFTDHETLELKPSIRPKPRPVLLKPSVAIQSAAAFDLDSKQTITKSSSPKKQLKPTQNINPNLH